MNERGYWRYDDWPSWCGVLDPWISENFASSVLARFHANVEPDWLGWLDKHCGVREVDQSCRAQMLAKLKTQYQGVRVYHGTRLRSIEALSAVGLRAWSADQLRCLARDTFRSFDIPDAVLARAIESAYPEHRAMGGVYTFANINAAFPGRPVCFCENGSEWLDHVAILMKLPAHREVMRRQTRPYLVACDVPWCLVDSASTDSLAESALCTLLVHRFFPHSNYSMPSDSDLCVTLPDGLPPRFIREYSDLEFAQGRTDIPMSSLIWKPFQQ